MSNNLVTLGKNVPIYLCDQPTSMTLGLPGLEALVRNQAKKDPDKGLYVFVSKDFRRVKLFYWDKNGYAMWYKHVPKKTFRIAQGGGYHTITGVNLKELLAGKFALPRDTK